MEDDLTFKVVEIAGAHDLVIARAANAIVARAAFEAARVLSPAQHLQMRHGARIIRDSARDGPP